LVLQIKAVLLYQQTQKNKFKNTEKMDKLQHRMSGLIMLSIERNIQENFKDAIITIKKANVTDTHKENAINIVIEAQKDIEKANARILKALENIPRCQKRK